MITTEEIVPKWPLFGNRWHWCVGYDGPTLCGAKHMKSIGECRPGPVNRRHECRRCRRAKRAMR